MRSFFLTRKVMKMQPQIIESRRRKLPPNLMESDDVDAAALFPETLTSMLAGPVAGILRSIEETRDVLGEAMQVAASGGDRPPRMSYRNRLVCQCWMSAKFPNRL